MNERPIIVHSLEDAEAALAAAADLGVPVTLRSAPGAARYLGATVFRDIAAQSGARVDFGDEDSIEALDLLDLDDPEAAVRTWLREGK